MANEAIQQEYPVFKGLQRPLEFMGLRGRYIGWAAITGIVGFLSLAIAYATLGVLAGLIAATVVLGGGAALILIKQRNGLHSKKRPRGQFIMNCTHRL